MTDRSLGGGTVASLPALLVLLLALSPLLWLVVHGALTGSLWMDEVNYLTYTERPEVRERAPGERAGRLDSALFGMFGYPNLLRPYRAVGESAWESSPEVMLRLPSLLAILGLAALAFRVALRHGLVGAGLAGLAAASVPVLQFYAFEGRVYAVASLTAAAFVVLASRWIEDGGRARLTGVVVLGILLPYLSLWAAPLVAGAGAWSLVGVWKGDRHRSVQLLMATLPGLVMALVQVYWFRVRFPHQTSLRFSRISEPLEALRQTARNLWTGPAGFSPTASEHAVSFGSVLAVFTAIVLVAQSLRWRSPSGRAAGIVLLALPGVLLAAAVVPGFVPGRYEVPWVAAALVALATRPGRLRLGALFAIAFLGLAVTPWTEARIAGKGNGRQIVETIRAHGDAEREAIAVWDHLGWDPLLRYPVHFYAQARGPESWSGIHLPSMEPLGADFMLFDTVVDSERARSVQDPARVEALPAWLEDEGGEALWIVVPESALHRHGNVLMPVLREAGYGLARAWRISGRPVTRLEHWTPENPGRQPSS